MLSDAAHVDRSPLEDMKPEPFQALSSELRDLVGRIAELIDLFARADSLLAQILPATLDRAALGLAEAAKHDGED